MAICIWIWSDPFIQVWIHVLRLQTFLFSFCEKDWLWPSKGESPVQFIWWSLTPTSGFYFLASSLIIAAGCWNYFFLSSSISSDAAVFQEDFKDDHQCDLLIGGHDPLDWWPWWCSDPPLQGPHWWCSIRLNTCIFIRRRKYCNFCCRKPPAASIADIVPCLQCFSVRLCMHVNPQMSTW